MELLTIGKQVLKTLNAAGYEAYFVGGMVRDDLLKRPIYDIDITTSATPDVVMSLFEKTIATGLAHGTVTVIINKTPIEVTTFRVETGYSDYRHPTDVVFTSSLEEDLKRRDFTVNAIAKDINNKLYDPMGGLVDLNQKILRCVGNPIERFTEDPLRMLRGIRFSSKLGFLLEKNTLNGMKRTSSLIANISKERIKKELEGLVKGEYRQQGIQILFDSSILDSLEELSTLSAYKNYDFTYLIHPILLFTLASLQLDDVNSYIDSWPFSKEEKKCIRVLRSCIKEPIPMAYFAYRYQEDWTKLYHELKCFLAQERTPYPMITLPIQNRKELEIDVATVTKLIQRPKGPWIQQLLETIEYKVVTHQLINDREVLIEFVKTYQ